MNNNNDPQEIEYIQHDSAGDTSRYERAAEQSAPQSDYPRSVIMGADADENQKRSAGFSFITFDGTNIRTVKLDWKTRLLLMTAGAVGAVLLISIAISAAIVLVIAAVAGGLVYGASRLMAKIQGR